VITVNDPQAERALMASKQRVAALFKQHKLVEAHQAAREYRDGCARALGDTHPAVASATADLGLMALELGTLDRVDEALDHFTASLALCAF